MKANLANYSGGRESIYIIIGGKGTGRTTCSTRVATRPQQGYCQVLMGHLEFVHKGITSTMAVKADWERVPLDEKIQMFLMGPT